ncbi:poly-gamma-glutamate synthase PgsB [Aliidiomarina maris]|uniref:Poly-gamma-glutamate synthase PgsB n=1 Tax=Aliidiomarina maris TaxID=531312 RepID=A0A327X709_9GAMM|nr:poly-gamma-glutamate synthase PgsB [Aliidiomarina maris]MCL5049838.1 poly-gamma-glutamate synthase PgsB [Bacillota bacterium]RAK01683.1 poly-gamma-glutamate synthase PgsB/CapB [Aliidiomarina maris]RUO28505.1 poly-gamma-glutamate synthase PgsB [Aliidiomarina maris]
MAIPETLAVMAALWLVLVIAGLGEAWRHRRILKSIPVRVHVNGTRGKTSVTRLIAAGLRGGGKRVCAKTTGSAAAFTDPEGREFSLYRIAGANIIEQMRLIARMAKLKPEIVVVECMALQPHYQSLTELRMVRSNVGVITNARADHLDVMGPGERDVGLALAGSTPVGGDLFTAERDLLDIFELSTQDRGSRLHGVTLNEVNAISDQTLRQFQYSEHAENVALALKVCEHLGVDRDAALQGMIALEPEAGAMRIMHLEYFRRDMIFVNAFAANDPESTGGIWHRLIERHGEGRKLIALVNCRADRPHRSQQMAEAAVTWTPADRYIVMGSGTLMFARMAVKAGIDPNKIIVMEQGAMVDVIETIFEEVGARGLVVGMCNIHGGGEDVARFFQNRALREEDV